MTTQEAIGAADGGTREFTHNALAVAVSGAVTGVFGLLFWFAAGRLFPTASVGAASALINTTTMVSTLSSATLGGMYERFLGNANSAARSAVLGGQAITVTISGGVSIMLATFGPLHAVLHTGGEIAGYGVFQATMCVFALQDHVATGLGVARWSAVKNIAHSITKLLTLVGLTAVATPFAIVFSWWIPALVAGVALGFLNSKRMRSSPTACEPPALPPQRELWSFFVGSTGLVVAGTAVPLVMPLVVVARFGVEKSAYFAISWSLISAAVIVMHMMVGPFVSAVSTATPEESVQLLRRFGLIVALLSMAAGIGLGLLGPLLLRFVGYDYYINGRTLMYFAAMTVPLVIVVVLYQASSRILRRMRLAVALECLSAVIVLTGICLSPTNHGLGVIGIWFLLAQVVVAVLATGPLIRNLARLSRVQIP